MNKAQRAHSKHIADTFVKLQQEKYEKGQKEHGTTLYELDPLWLLEQAREEFIDGFTYVQTVIDLLEDQITINLGDEPELQKFFESMLKTGKLPKSTTDKSHPK